MANLLTLVKPITMQLYRTYLEREAFQVKIGALQTNLDLDIPPNANGFIKLECHGVVFYESENNTLYSLDTLGGSQTLNLRVSNIQSIAPADPLLITES